MPLQKEKKMSRSQIILIIIFLVIVLLLPYGVKSEQLSGLAFNSPYKAHQAGDLLLTPLASSNGAPYAMAQGPVSIGGFNVPASQMGATEVFNPKENILAGTKYLKSLIQRFNGDLKLALAAYNTGPAIVEKLRDIPPFKETINYVNKVLKSFQTQVDSK